MKPSKSHERHWPEIGPVLKRLGTTRKGTLRNFRYAARLLDDFEDPRDVTQDDVDAIRDAVLDKYAVNGARVLLINLRSILRRVYGRHDLILKVPSPDDGPKDVFEAEDVARMMDAADDDPLLYAVLHTQYGAALRPGETMRLNVEDVDLEAREVRIRQGKRGSRAVNLNPEAVEALRRWLEVRPEYRDNDGESLFVTQRGGGNKTGANRPSRAYLAYHVKRLAAEVGIKGPAYPHMIRASGITHLLNAGVNPEVVRRQAGHANVNTTWGYNRPTRGDERRVLEEAWDRIRRYGPSTREETALKVVDAFREGKIGMTELRSLLNVVDSVEKKEREPGSATAGYA